MDENTVTPPTLQRPPTADELAAALDVLALTAEARETAAMHLAMPVDCPVGMAVWLEDGRWHHRTQSVSRSDDPVADAVALAAASRLDDDEYHDLSTADPVSWCKAVRSGARVILFGSDLLLPGPAIAAEPGVPTAVLQQVLRLAVTDPEFQAPTLLETSLGAHLVDGGRGWMMVRPC